MRISDWSSDVCSSDLLILASSTLDNSQGGRISAKGDLGITTGALANQQSGSISSSARLQLKAAQANNSSQGRITSKGALSADLQCLRSEERSVGKECVSTGRSRGVPDS